MDKQITLSALNDELSQVRTKKKEFLDQIERIIPWGNWLDTIRPCYYKGERGNKPYDLERMLRIYLIQNLYNLSDMATVAEVIPDARPARKQRSGWTQTASHTRNATSRMRSPRLPN